MANEYIIREIMSKDIPAFIKLVNIALRKEFETSGVDLNGLSKKLKRLLTTRKVAVRLLQTISGWRVKILVADIKGEIIGASIVVGKSSLKFAVHVHNLYRKQGIAKSLTETMLNYVGEMNKNEVISDILVNNSSAIRFCQKAGFRIYYYYNKYTSRLSHNRLSINWKDSVKVIDGDVVRVRNFRGYDLKRFEKIKKRRFSNKRVFTEKLVEDIYNQSFLTRIFISAFLKYKIKKFSLIYKNIPIGFLMVLVNSGKRTGIINTPVITDDNCEFLSVGLKECLKFFQKNGCNKIYVDIPVQCNKMIKVFENIGFRKESEWVKIVKRIY